MFQTKQKLLFSSIGFLGLLLTLAPICLAGVNAAPYLRLGAGARSLGMGSAFTAIADDATSTIWNPAGLPAIEDLTFTISTAKLAFDRKQNFMGIVKNLSENSSLGFAWINAGVDDIIEFSAEDVQTGRFDFSSNAFSLSYGHALANFNLGASLRILSDSFGLDDVDGSSENGFGGIDLGFLGHSWETVSYGIALRNLGGSIGDADVPVLLDLGVAFRLLKKHRATFAFDIEREFLDLGEESTTGVRIGAEYFIAKTFAIRGGTQATRDRRNLFAGFGVNVSGLQIDYALKASDDATRELGAGNSHFVSLSYTY
jgi:hypothetical protein